MPDHAAWGLLSGSAPARKFWFLRPFSSASAVRASVRSSSLAVYDATASLLLVLSALVTLKQFFGEPITCEAETEYKKILNDICWERGTMIGNTSAYDPEHIVSTGVRYIGKDYQDGSDYLVGYYQWVWLVLGLQAVAFHLPYMAWKRCEGGAVTKYVAKLLKEEQDGGGDGEEREDRRCGDKKCGECGGGGDGSGADRDNGSCGGGGRARDETAEAIGRRLSAHFGRFVGYSASYVMLEVAAFAAAVGHIFLTDWFLHGRFVRLGMDFLLFDGQWRVKNNPMEFVFPTMTTCTVEYYGPSGNKQNIEALCVVPLNNINEKAYLLLWFWLHLVSLFAAAHLFVLLLLVTFSFFRAFVLKYACPDASPEDVDVVSCCSGFADFLVVRLILRNIRSRERRRSFLRALAGSLRTQYQRPPPYPRSGGERALLDASTLSSERGIMMEDNNHAHHRQNGGGGNRAEAVAGRGGAGDGAGANRRSFTTNV